MPKAALFCFYETLSRHGVNKTRPQVWLARLCARHRSQNPLGSGLGVLTKGLVPKACGCLSMLWTAIAHCNLSRFVCLCRNGLQSQSPFLEGK